MNKELLLQKLKEFKMSLPDNIEGEVSKDQAIINSQNAYLANLEEMKRLELAGENYDLLSYEREEIKLDYLNLDKQNLEEEMKKTSKQIESLNRYINSLVSSSSVDLEKEIAKREKYIEYYKEAYDTGKITNSEYQKFYNDLTLEIEKLGNSEYIKKRNEEIEKAKKQVEELRKLQQENNERLNNYKKEINNSLNRIYEMKKTDPSNVESKINELKENMEALNIMNAYFKTDLKEETDELIAYLENNDVISEEEVRNRINNLNALANSNFYNLKLNEIKEEDINKRIEEIDIRRKELIEKTSNENNYVVASALYEELSNNMEVYAERISEIDRQEDENRLEYEKLTSEIAGIPYYKSFIAEAEKNIKLNSSRTVIDEQTKRLIELDKAKIKNYKKIVKELEDPMHKEAVENRIKVLENERYSRSIDRQSYVNLYENSAKRLYTINETDEQKDIKELEELTALKNALLNEKKLIKTSPLNRMNEIVMMCNNKSEITLKEEVKSNDEKEEVILPPFIKNFTDEQRKLYDSFMSAVDKNQQEDVIEDFSRINPCEEENKQEEVSAPEGTETQNIESKPKENKKRSKVVGYKDLAKEKLDKIKEFFQKNWKLVVGSLALAAALAVSIKAVQVSKTNAPVLPINTPTISDTQVPEIKIEVEEPVLPVKNVDKSKDGSEKRTVTVVSEEKYKEMENHHEIELKQDQEVTKEEFKNVEENQEKLIEDLVIEDNVNSLNTNNEVSNQETIIEEVTLNNNEESEIKLENPKEVEYESNPSEELNFGTGVGLRYNKETGKWEQFNTSGMTQKYMENEFDSKYTTSTNRDWVNVDDILDEMDNNQGRTL